jgi:hypothetical protein
MNPSKHPAVAGEPAAAAAAAGETERMDDDGFRAAAGKLSEAEFLARYGGWEAMSPAQVAAELAGCDAPWRVAGGRAARAGASTSRRHDDTDVSVLAGDVDAVRAAMTGWHLWENVDGALRPLLPGIPVRPECGQLWVRRDAWSAWRMEFLVDRVSSPAEWVFKRDQSVRLPWERAAQTVAGISYLRPEIALLYKAGQDRAKDRADLAAARLTDEGRAWLAVTLDRLGYREWAERLS